MPKVTAVFIGLMLCVSAHGQQILGGGSSSGGGTPPMIISFTTSATVPTCVVVSGGGAGASCTAGDATLTITHNFGISLPLTPWLGCSRTSTNSIFGGALAGVSYTDAVGVTANQFTLPLSANTVGYCQVSTGGMGPTGDKGAAGATGPPGVNGTNGAISTIYNSGSALAVQPFLNFVNGGCVNNGGATRTDCTFSGGATATTNSTWPLIVPWGNAPSADFTTASPNGVNVMMFEAPVTRTVNFFVFRLAVSGGASSKLAFGIYSLAGAKLCALDNIDFTATANYYKTAPNVTTNCVLAAGTSYYFASAASEVSTGKIEIINGTAGAWNALNAGTQAYFATTANHLSAGVLPSTLGALSADSGIVVPSIGLVQ